ncbi:MAG: peptidoglycan DD-metalloendopeptidase family protein [Desulfuromonadales bacterium]|nr:peptidoglycan DD-metalloendopeptidase family protein [Desulfuromonadales bacterium]
MSKQIKRDYQPPRSSSQNARQCRSRRRFIPALFLLLGLTVAGLILFGAPPNTGSQAQIAPVQISAPPVNLPVPPDRKEFADVIKPGETISSLLGDYFSPQEIHELNKRSKKVFPFTRICAGQPYKICLSDNRFESFTYEIDDEQQLIIRSGDELPIIEKVDIEYQLEQELVRSTIESSLFEAVADIGESSELAIRLADIFAWDIDFIRDIREGDTFQALVEKRYRDGNPAGYGKILAAEFVNRGETYRAIYFQDGDKSPSYYNPDGKSVRKAFLKAPLSFSRISSGFSMKRFHPITKTWKSHPAIDYAAPPGTPIKTVGDGTITRIGYTRGNGNFIEIRHNNSYSTLYLHMSKFARKMSKGKKVVQGQVIGYVGSTGLATGPHLCFRMRKNGEPVNPYKVKVPASKPVSNENLAAFKSLVQPLVAQLEGRDIKQVAKAVGTDPAELTQ